MHEISEGSPGPNKQTNSQDNDSASAARRRFIASILASAKTRDALAQERDKAATARDVAAVLEELVSGVPDQKAAKAREFASKDRQNAHTDRVAAAADRAELMEGNSEGASAAEELSGREG